MQSVIVAFAMYSKIPMPKIEWNKKNMKYALCFFPLVGLVIGVIIYCVGSLGYYYQWNQLLFASVMTSIPVIVTGGIHLDGLLDTIDALSAYCDRDKRLEILKDSNSGAFAIIGGICYFVLSLGVWSTTPRHVLGVLVISYAMSRTMSAFSIVTFPLAKNTGLAAVFQEGAQKRNVQVVMCVLYIIEIISIIWLKPQVGIGCTLVSLIVFAYYYYVCKRHFGGISGDLAGYFLQICEIAMLIVATAVGKIIL